MVEFPSIEAMPFEGSETTNESHSIQPLKSDMQTLYVPAEIFRKSL